MDKIYVAALKDEVVGLDYFHFLGVGKINATIKTTMMITLHVYCRCKLCKLTDHYNSIHIP